MVSRKGNAIGNNTIELYESDDGKVRLNVQLDGETVWLSAAIKQLGAGEADNDE